MRAYRSGCALHNLAVLVSRPYGHVAFFAGRLQTLRSPTSAWLYGCRARGSGGRHPASAAADDKDGGLVRAARVRAGRRCTPQRPAARLEAHQGLLKRQRLSALFVLLFDRCLDVSVWFCDCSSCLVAAAFADSLPSKWHANVVMCDMQVDPARNSKLFIKQLATEPLPMPEV